MMFDHSCNNSSSWTFRVFLLALAAVAVHASRGDTLSSPLTPAERLTRSEAQNQLDRCHELLEKELNLVQEKLEDAAKSCGRWLPEDVSAVLSALTPVPTPTHGTTKSGGKNRTRHYNNLYERDLRLKLREKALDMLEQHLIFKIQNLVRREECSKCSMYEANELTSCSNCSRIFHPAGLKPEAEIQALLKKLPNHPLRAGWREITMKSGRVYYTNRIGDAKALASGFFEKPIGQDRSVKPRAIPEYYAQARENDKRAWGSLMEKIWTQRRAAGRQCYKCTRIYTDQEMREHVRAESWPRHRDYTDQKLAEIIKARGAEPRTCARCDLVRPFY